MFDKIFKTVMMMCLIIIIFLLWTGLDNGDEDEYETPNIVTIDYECDKLDEYEKVPDEVKEECKDRSKK